MTGSVPVFLLERAPYLLFVLPVTAGAYFMLAQRNLLLSFVGLYLLQSGVIFFYVLLSVRANATIPILMEDAQEAYLNPLPHALMLTAIVVGVALLGVALSMMRRIQLEEGTLQESGARKRGSGQDPKPHRSRP